MVRIVAISDTHTETNIVVPDGDILVHAGDISYRGTFGEMNRGMQWLGKLPHKIKIFVCGNHDWLGQLDPALMKALADENGIIYLQDEPTEILNLKFYGSPRTPFFNAWAFNEERGEQIGKWWSKIPDDTEILVTHGGPMGILDKVEIGSPYESHVGCEELRKRVDALQNLKVHIFGHLHSNNGQFRDASGKLFVNAAIMTEEYKPLQVAHVLDIP